MRLLDHTTGLRGAQAMVAMRDGVRPNTFVYLPPGEGPFPVILQRTPYGIAVEYDIDAADPAKGWLPDPQMPMLGALLRGWKAMAARGYAVVYQDCRGRHASEGIDRVYADDAADGYDALDWISRQPWCNGRIGMAGSSAAATTTLAAASQRHPALKCFWAQVGGSSIYDDVVYEGGGIEMERLWLWVAANIPGLSPSHRAMVRARFGLDDAGLGRVIDEAKVLASRLEAAKTEPSLFASSSDWLRLPLKGCPAFSIVQPFLDEMLSHPAPDDFRAAHDFRSTIDIPGFHATSWYDIFQTSVIAAFQEIQARAGRQRLWIGPNAHYFIYESQFWPRDPFFEWFDHWLKGIDTPLMREPAVLYSPRAWVDPAAYRADDWRKAASWPPVGTRTMRLSLGAGGTLDPEGAEAAGGGEPGGASGRTFVCDPRHPIPTRGGRNMLIEAGPQDQRAVRRLEGYGLVYRGVPLAQALTLAGPVTVRLTISSDCPDTDVVAKLVEAHPDGRALLLMDGVGRAMLRDGPPQPLHPGEPVTLTIRLGHIHHTVAAGCRLELDVTGSNFPRRARSTNSGRLDRAGDGEDAIRVATNSVHHSGTAACYVELTIMP